MDKFSISDSADGSDAAAALYREELNDLKIEKLGNRVTLISVLLPCLIAAVLGYAYYDFQNRVSTISDTGQSQVETVVQDFEAKINAIEVDLAKIKFDMKKEIPELNAQTTIIMEKLAALSDLLETKIGKDETDKALTTLKTTLNDLTGRMDTLSGQQQTAINILDRTTKDTLDIVNQNVKNLEIRMTKRVDETIDSAIGTAFDDKLSDYTRPLELKVTEMAQSVESKLASLQEVVQVLSDNKKQLKTLDQGMTELTDLVTTLKKEQGTLKSRQQKNEKDLASKKGQGGVDKNYVDSRIASKERRLNAKITDLSAMHKKLSMDIIKLKVEIDSQRSSRQSGGISQSDLDE